MLVVSVIASAITAKIVATYYFKKVDGYVKEMCEMTEKNNNLIRKTRNSCICNVCGRESVKYGKT